MSTNLNKLYSPAEAGRTLGGISGATVKRTAAELGIEPLRTIGGIRLFTHDQLELIRVERIRRGKENDARINQRR